ncbi:MAG: ABC transporter permease [Bacteroidales bacterium]
MSQHIKLIWKTTVIETKLFLREPMAAFFTVVFPLMLLGLFGAIYGNEPADIFGGRGMVDMSVPAYIAMIISTVGLLSITINVTSYREKGILRRYRTTPMRPYVILLDNLAVNFVMTLLGALLLILLGKVVWHLQFEGKALAFLFAFSLSALSFFSLGFIIASLATTARVAQVVGMVIFYPMLFLSGAAIPLQVMPDSIQKVASFLPLYYVVDLLQGMWFGEPLTDHWLAMGVLAGMLVIGGGISALFFRWE